MNDNFMHSLRQEPDPRFAKQLKNRLDASTQKHITTPFFSRPRLALGLTLTVLLVFVSMAFAVPSVRAKLQDLIVKIGEQNFLVSHEYPTADEVTTVLPVSIPLSQAAENGISLPTYSPNGFELADDHYSYYPVKEEDSFGWSEFIWTDEDGQRIMMVVSDGNPQLLVGTEAIEEVLLNELYPAGLIHGEWDQNGQVWNTSISLFTLSFEKDGRSIQLIGQDPETLILMAESLFP